MLQLLSLAREAKNGSVKDPFWVWVISCGVLSRIPLTFVLWRTGRGPRLSWTTNQRLTNDEYTSCEYHKGTFKCLVKLYFIGQVADKKISTKSCLTTKRCFFLNSIIILLIRKPLQYNNLVLFCTFLQRHEQILVLVHITSGYCPRTKNWTLLCAIIMHYW